MKKYQIIYADPPWNYNSSIRRNTRSRFNHVSEHYSVMNTEDIKNLPIDNISDKDCLLFMWVTSPLLEEGLEVMKSWGFKYGTIAFCWNKINPMPGSYTISQVEICLVGRKGKIPQPRGLRNIKQFIEEKRTKHSKKPNDVRKRIELMFPKQDKVELFAREKYYGWDIWGDEVDSDIELSSQSVHNTNKEEANDK